MTNVRQNGAFTEYGPSHTKSKSSGVNNIQTGGHIASTRNHGGHHRMNSIMSHHRHSAPSRYEHNNERNHECRHRHHNNDRYDRYDREYKPSFGEKLGGFLKGLLPIALGIGGALLLGNPGALGGIFKTVGGFLGKLFGGTKAPTTPEVITPETKTPGPTTPEVKTPEVKPPVSNTPVVNTPAPPTTTEDHTVVKDETISKLIKERVIAANPNATEEQIKQLVTDLTQKTIDANKDILNKNLENPLHGPKYAGRALGEYIEIGNILKLILK